MNGKNRVCPVEMAAGLDNRFRRWFQNPEKILNPYIREGMTVLDVGCGPGFFSLDMARMVGQQGRVIASDVQDGMLEKLKKKIHGTETCGRITLHKCGDKGLEISDSVDFVLLFYVLHEMPDQENVFAELKSLLKPAGRILIVEPPFHVRRKDFLETIGIAEKKGFIVLERPRIFFGMGAVLGHSGENL
jgi:ubiquinone/menaquinone biosynthesis C-methylase UbiE